MAIAKLKPIEERDPYAALVLDAFDQQEQQSRRIDIPVKCTRCRHETMESAWLDKPEGNSVGISMSVKTCPKCGCKSYYDMRPQVAWCWASGLIEVGDQVPANQPDGSGAIVIARGPKVSLDLSLRVLARRGKGASAGKLLVPGVPEAGDGDSALEAMEKWIAWCAAKPVLGCKDVVWEVAHAR